MLTLFIAVPPETIQPYLDPVSQGAILQTLLAILLGISLFVRMFWRKINEFILRIRGKSTDAPAEATDKNADQ